MNRISLLLFAKLCEAQWRGSEEGLMPMFMESIARMEG